MNLDAIYMQDVFFLHKHAVNLKAQKKLKYVTHFKVLIRGFIKQVFSLGKQES